MTARLSSAIFARSKLDRLSRPSADSAYPKRKRAGRSQLVAPKTARNDRRKVLVKCLGNGWRNGACQASRRKFVMLRMVTCLHRLGAKN
jgi:hypothetical protein